MSYEVLVDDLRAAAGSYDKVADSLGTDGVKVDHVEPTSFGHVELTAWVKAVAEQLDKASQALHDGATGLADSLGVAAHHYETTDDQVATYFTNPFGTPSAPFTPSNPFAPPNAPKPSDFIGPTP